MAAKVAAATTMNAMGQDNADSVIWHFGRHAPHHTRSPNNDIIKYIERPTAKKRIVAILDAIQEGNKQKPGREALSPFASKHDLPAMG